jgi:peptidoglycan/LPS O-acetylase OafA/YrhL
MARYTRGRIPGATRDLEKVSLDPSHWRSGRIFLLSQGALIGILGATALCLAIVNAATGPARIPLLDLRFSLLQGAILLGYAALAGLASLSRRAALWFAGLAAALGFALVITCAVAVFHHAPGPPGFDLPDMLLYAVLAACNTGLLMWLNADAIEGPAWVPRRRSRNG